MNFGITWEPVFRPMLCNFSRGNIFPNINSFSNFKEFGEYNNISTKLLHEREHLFKNIHNRFNFII